MSTSSGSASQMQTSTGSIARARMGSCWVNPLRLQRGIQ
jgi:hypothetical protein